MGDLFGGLFGSDPDPLPPPPVVTPPPVMPIPDDEAIMRAKKKALAARVQSSGRQSTILSDLTEETLG